MKSADIHLPYFKQGDDLHHHLSRSASVEEALEAHAEQLEHAAAILRKVKDMVSGQHVEFDADTHMIQVTGPDEIIEALIDSKLASRLFDEDEEFDEEDNDDDQSGKVGWDSVF